MLIDTHAHINYLKNPKLAIGEALEAGVKKIILPGVKTDEFAQIIGLIEQYDCLYGAIGIHPSELLTYSEHALKEIVKLASHKKIIAIGEIGLDYYWEKENAKEQKEVFKAQLELALALNKPVLIHDRDAHLDTFEILKKSGVKKVVMHCFSGSSEFAKECVKEGWLIAIGGVVTFKNAKKLKEVAKEIPLESILLETDCPYLTPCPFRGEENSPKYLSFVAKEIANLKDITYDEVVDVTGENALRFFGIEGE